MRLTRSLTSVPLVGLLGLALAPTSCRELEAIELEECGNLVVEPALGEDCDGSSELGTCGNFNPESKNVIDDGICKFLCDPTVASTGCPEDGGFRCGADGICRRPSGAFVQGLDAIGTLATRLDGRALQGALDRSDELLLFDDQKLQTFQFDLDGRVIATQTVPAKGRQLAIGAFSVNSNADTEESQPAVALRYEASPTAVGIALYAVEDGSLSPVSMLDPELSFAADDEAVLFRAQGRAPALAELLMSFDAQGLRVYDPRAGAFVRITDQLTFDEDRFAGIAVDDVLFANAGCAELALAPSDGEVRVIPICDKDGLNDDITVAEMSTISLPPGIRIARTPDNDQLLTSSIFFALTPFGDDLLDVFVVAHPMGDTTDKRLYVARQVDNGMPLMRNGFEPTFSELNIDAEGCKSETNTVTDTAQPLAFADFNEDEKVDVVTEATVFISRNQGLRYTATVCGDFRWHAAIVADLTGDGALDLVVQEQEKRETDPPIKFGTSLLALINNGQGAFTQYRLTTSAVDDVEVADFDGDGLADVAYTLENTGQETESVFLSYGRATNGPAPAEAVADFEYGVSQLASGRFRGDDGAADLVVVDETGAHFVLVGSGARQLIAPILFENQLGTHAPTFLGSTRRPAGSIPPERLTSLATFTQVTPGDPPVTRSSIWATDFEEIDNPRPSGWPDVAENGTELFSGETPLLASIDLDPTEGDGEEVVFILPDLIALYSLTDDTDETDVSQGSKWSVDHERALEPLEEAPPPLVVDLDRDGLDDILYFAGVDFDTSQVQLTLLRNTGAGPTASNAFDISSVLVDTDETEDFFEALAVPPAIAKVRLDGDARPEVVVIGDTVSVLTVSDGKLTMTSIGNNALGFPRAAAGGDFNGDGIDDIALAAGGQVQILFGVDLVDLRRDEKMVLNLEALTP